MSKHESVWKSTAMLKSHSKLSKDIECDVLVIGGGISGVLTTYFLKKNNIDAVLVESSAIASGQTERTTAKITSQHGACYQQIEKSYGFDKAVLYANANEKAIDDFDKLIFDNRIDCDFSRLPSCLYSLRETDTLIKEYNFTNKCRISSSLTKRTELPFSVKLALRYTNQAQFNPYPFISKLCDYISIFENTHVLRIEDNIAYCDGCKIKAKKIVFATHYPIVNFPGLYFVRMHQSRSYVLALKNAQNLKAMYHSADKGGLSFRSFNGYLLLSGGSHRTGENPAVPSYLFLSDRAKELYAGCEVVYSFSAQDCMSPDHMPYAGVYAKSKPDWYVLTGYSKWGMTDSMMCAQLVSDLISDNSNELVDLLSPSRFSASIIKPILNETTHAVKNLSKSMFRIPLNKVSDIDRGSGKIVMYNGKRCAVYRDENDEIFALSAHCPHLGCELSFNEGEKTWDCPCHGSRFSITGELIDSPSRTSLKRYK